MPESLASPTQQPRRDPRAHSTNPLGMLYHSITLSGRTLPSILPDNRMTGLLDLSGMIRPRRGGRGRLYRKHAEPSSSSPPWVNIRIVGSTTRLRNDSATADEPRDCLHVPDGSGVQYQGPRWANLPSSAVGSEKLRNAKPGHARFVAGPDAAIVARERGYV